LLPCRRLWLESSPNGWHKQRHDFLSLPVYVRDNTLLALGNNDQKPDYAWHEGTAFQLFNLADGAETRCEVPAANGETVFMLCVKREGKRLTVEGSGHATGWTLCLRNIQQVTGIEGGSSAGHERGIVVTPEHGAQALIITL